MLPPDVGHRHLLPEGALEGRRGPHVPEHAAELAPHAGLDEPTEGGGKLLKTSEVKYQIPL